MTRPSLPDPDDVLAFVEKLPEKVSLARYWSSVELLREKGYSWREISAILEKKGIKVSYRQLHRYDQRREAGLPGEDEEDET